MEPRLNFYKASPDAIKAMLALEASVSKLGLEQGLIELVKLRASQINGCGYCVDMHSTDARKHGETERRLYGVAAWHESPLFTPRERAALGWTEALTRVSETHAPDADYEALCAEFNERERVDLSLAIGAINVWNRLAIGFRSIPAA